MAYILALPENICERLMKCMIHILKALDISYWKIQENIEIITNHKLQFWTKIPKNGYCVLQHGVTQWPHKTKKTGSFFYEIEVSFFILFHHARHLQQIHWYKIFCGMYGFAVMFIFFSISFFFLFSKCWRWNNWFRLCYGRSFYSYVKKWLHSSKISWIPTF